MTKLLCNFHNFYLSASIIILYLSMQYITEWHEIFIKIHFMTKYLSTYSKFFLVIYLILFIELDQYLCILGLILLYYKILLQVTRLKIRFLKLLRYLKPLCCFSINILKTFLKGIAIFSFLQSYLSVNCTKKFFFKFNIGY